jgi:iron complex transport system substrate-binding protein
MLTKSIVYAVPLFLLAGTSHAQEFPLTMPHAYGETTIPDKPARIVTWGWAVQDAVVALGEVPVGIPHFTYGGDENGALTWTKDAVTALGGEFPTILSQSGGVPYEAIAALMPDVIIAVYSGISQEEYTRLSQIAPVVAFPDKPWSTTWQDTITLAGTAIGKASEADALVAELEQFIVDETAKYPQVQGATFAGIGGYDGAVSVYTAVDPRMTFLEDAGLVLAPSVGELAEGEGFYYSLSFERVNELTTDIYITYSDTDADAEAFFGHPAMARTPQVVSGAIASMVGPELINSVSPPSALSLKWGYPEYIRRIGAAVDKAKAQ